MMAITLPQITTDENGTVWIDKTNTKVIEIVLNQRMSNVSPELLAQQMPHLSLAQVIAALAYYDAHKTRLDAKIEARKTWVEAQARESLPLSRSALLARRQAV